MSRIGTSMAKSIISQISLLSVRRSTELQVMRLAFGVLSSFAMASSGRSFLIRVY